MEYIDFSTSNITSIDVNFEDYEKGDRIEPHMHHYHEFTMVTRGTCLHRFRDVEVPIIPGDIFLIPPHEAHSYSMNSAVSIVNCYFFPERLGRFAEYVSDTMFTEEYIPSSLDDVMRQWDSLAAQGILHLPPAEAMEVEGLLRRIQAEHSNLRFDAEYMKAALLQMIIVIFKRAKNNSPQRLPLQPNRKKQLILPALSYIENHFTEDLTVEEIAGVASLSVSYFRGLFKETTGLSPLDYLNRLRIAKSLDLLREGELTIAEVGSRMGIPDPNYFTRIFKKIMGYPPSTYMKR